MVEKAAVEKTIFPASFGGELAPRVLVHGEHHAGAEHEKRHELEPRGVRALEILRT